MSAEDMKKRTFAFALRVIRLVESLPPGKVSDVIGRQLVKSGTSVAANYRASCRAKSTADFIAKMGIVKEEGDESVMWIEMLVEAGLVKPERVKDLMDEGHQVVAIVVASIKTARTKAR